MKIGDSENSQDSALDQSIKGVLVAQCIAMVLVLSGIILFCFIVDADSPYLLDKLKSATYGALLAITGTIISARSVRRSSKAASDTGFSAMVPIFSGLLNKLVIVGGGIAFGLIVLDLEPILVVAGYVVVQLATASRLLVNED